MGLKLPVFGKCWTGGAGMLITACWKQILIAGDEDTIGFSPQQRVSLRSAISPMQTIDLDILFRYVDSNKAAGFSGSTIIDAYVSLDVRLAWRPVEGVELSLVGQNLLAGQHQEYRQETFTTPTEIDRGMYGKLSWRF